MCPNNTLKNIEAIIASNGNNNIRNANAVKLHFPLLEEVHPHPSRLQLLGSFNGVLRGVAVNGSIYWLVCRSLIGIANCFIVGFGLRHKEVHRATVAP
ncbi:hypothetical protein LguiA_031134 [Lonicera macranthoides]